MNIKYKGKDVEVKFNYYSFKHMQDLDFSQLEELERKPFKMFDIAGILLLGALKSERKRNVTMDDVDKILKEYTDDEEKSVPELLSGLMEELQESGFFKSLQKMEQEEK